MYVAKVLLLTLSSLPGLAQAAEAEKPIPDTPIIVTAPGGDEIKLGPLEQRIVIALAQAADKGRSRAELAQIAQVAPSADDRNLDAAMFRLRRKIESATGKPSPIITMHGKGYAVTGTIELVNPA